MAKAFALIKLKKLNQKLLFLEAVALIKCLRRLPQTPDSPSARCDKNY